MQHASETLLTSAGRRAATVSLALLTFGTGLFAQDASEAAIRNDIELARGLAAEWQFVDLAEEVIADLESRSLTDELKAEIGLVKCEVYTSGARRENDAMLRDELFAKAVDAYADYIDKNPLSELIGQAQRGYVDVCNMSGRSLEKRLDEAVGEEATALREQIVSVLEEALKYTSDLKDELRAPSDEWQVAMKAEWSRVMFSRAQMYHTMARISEEGAFFYTQAERTLEELASIVGETTPPGLTAYLELADVYMSQGRPRDAADFAEYIVNTVWSLDPAERENQGFDEMSSEDKYKRWAFVEKGTDVLTESMLGAGRPEDALIWSLHFYNTWKQEGFNLSPDGYLSLLATARTLLDAGGHIGGSPAQGDLKWYETQEELEANTSRRNRRTALDLALSIAQNVNDDNKGNILQVRAQKLISDVISRPGVQVSPDVLFEAAQGELNNGNYADAVQGLKRVMRALDGTDEAMQIEYGAKVSFYLGESFRKQERVLEAAMAYREGAVHFGQDPEFSERNAKGFYGTASELRSKAPGVQEFEEMRLEAENLMTRLTTDTGEIQFRQAKRIYDQNDYAGARAKFLEVPEGTNSKEKAITYAALCLKKMKDSPAAKQEFLDYLNVWITDATHQATTPKAVAARKEARAMATYYLGTIAFEGGDYAETVKWLTGFHDTFPDQTSYAATAIYMVVLSHLNTGAMEQVRKEHDTMVELYPTNKFTGAAATKIFNTLLDRRADAEKSGDTEAVNALSRDMARYIRLGNQLDSTPNFQNLRTESTLWKDLGEHALAEEVLRAIIKRFADDPDRQDELLKFVKPDLGEVLLEQHRASEAFDVLGELVPKPDDDTDPRKPSSRVVAAWTRSIVGWVETDESGRQITPIPGVGGAENLADAANYCGKLLDMAKRDPGAWTLPWYERYFSTAYAYYQWGQVDSERLGAAKNQMEILRTELGEDLELIEDENLRRRLQWLWSKVR